MAARTMVLAARRRVVHTLASRSHHTILTSLPQKYHRATATDSRSASASARARSCAGYALSTSVRAARNAARHSSAATRKSSPTSARERQRRDAVQRGDVVGRQARRFREVRGSGVGQRLGQPGPPSRRRVGEPAQRQTGNFVQLGRVDRVRRKRRPRRAHGPRVLAGTPQIHGPRQGQPRVVGAGRQTNET